MSEGFDQKETQPLPKKIPIQERLTTTELKENFADLEWFAQFIEKRLYEAYGSSPTEGQRYDATQQVLEDLVSIAKDAGQFANQYRNFHVGGVALGLKKIQRVGENPWKVLFDANTKPTKDDMKWCAEQYLLDRAEASDGLKRILSFVVVAEPQSDNDSNMTQVTLTPCKLCRDRMDHLSKEGTLITPDTEVITADARQTAFRKFQRVKDLKVFHKEYREID